MNMEVALLFLGYFQENETEKVTEFIIYSFFFNKCCKALFFHADLFLVVPYK